MADDKDEVLSSPEVHFEPIIRLPEVETRTLEEDEAELIKLQTSEIIPLRGNRNATRMERKRNWGITPWMELKPNCGSDRAWVWSVPADYADEEPKQELLAIRFANAENAKKFKEQFDDCKSMVKEITEDQIERDVKTKQEEEADDVAQKLEDLAVKDGDGNGDKLSREASEESSQSRIRNQIQWCVCDGKKSKKLNNFKTNPELCLQINMI
uniref:RanBD1 domain-containing protein n=1 Tax=Strigamia maritima TaxID=126957 RepID=T1IXD8_STRMM